MKTALGHDAFIQAVVREFPEIEAALSEDPELLHVQMGEFRRFAQAAIYRDDFPMVQRCLALANAFYADADPALDNALTVSFLEGLDLGGARKIKKMMSRQLYRRYVEINQLG